MKKLFNIIGFIILSPILFLIFSIALVGERTNELI